ncbi:MAG: cobalt ECF transporter T component CbiQ [Peptococcaceae bacterium]|nr:cobalt ECF transporter T component CbiQ [Peptococcaceae bacterium]
MLQIDSYAYSSKLSRVHPGEKLAAALSGMLICLLATNPASAIAVIVIMIFLTTGRAGIPWSSYIKLAGFPLLFILFSAITTALSFTGNSEELILALHIKGVFIGFAKKDILMAAHLLVKSTGATLSLLFLALTTSITDIAMTMRKAGFPGLLLELMELVYRFIFVFMETGSKIFVSQSSRLGYRNLFVSCTSIGKLAGSLFINSYLHSQSLYTALLARGYNGEIKVLEIKYPFSVLNIAVIFFVILGIASFEFFY